MQATTPRIRPIVVGGAVLALFGAIVLVDPLRAAAAELLSVFRTEKIAVVETNQQAIINSMQNLRGKMTPELARQLAQVSGPQTLPTLEPTTPSAAADLVGPLLQPATMPAGLPVEPTRWGAMHPATYTLRPDVDAINAWLLGQGVPASLDPKLKGQSFQVVTPTVVVREWHGTDGRTLLIAQATSLQVSGTNGIDLQSMAQLAGQLAGAPASVLDQIRRIPDLAHTLPLPVGADVGEPVKVGEAQGVYYPAKAGGGALVWQKGGLTYLVGGDLSRAELLAVAVR